MIFYPTNWDQSLLIVNLLKNYCFLVIYMFFNGAVSLISHFLCPHNYHHQPHLKITSAEITKKRKREREGNIDNATLDPC